MEKILNNNFDIKEIIEENKKSKDIDKNLYDIAEKIVTEKVINQKGSDIESNKYNSILAKCILGDKASIRQMKEFIKQYLMESKKFDKEQIESLIQMIYVDNFGLGAIDDLVQDDTINEIWVNGNEHIWIEKNGLKKRLNRRFKNNGDVIRVMRQMLQFDRKEITPANPIVESKLADGSRITFIIPPVGLVPYMNIRKFNAFEITEENILGTKTINEEQLDFLKVLIEGRANILVIGETGSGKTSFLKFLYNYVNEKLRVGTIESNFELKLSEKYPDRNFFEYEEHEELGVDLGSLFKLCLRSSPDIIYLGEARWSEEMEALIKAMRRGHPGSIGTIHTNSAETAIDDCMNMILEDGKKRDAMLLRDRISRAIEFIVQIHRFENGDRKVVKITEVIPDDNMMGQYQLNDIWDYDERKNMFLKNGKILSKEKIKKFKFYGVSDEKIKNV